MSGAVAKKAKNDKIRVVQVGGACGCIKKTQVNSLKGLGLGRIGKSSILNNDPCVLGMIKKVAHLVEVEVAE